MDVVETGSRADENYELLLLKYKLLFDHARDIIMFIDSDGKILDANRSAIETYGYTKEELTEMFVFDLRIGDPQQFIKKQMQQALDKSINFETNHRTKDGRVIPVDVSSIGVMLEGKPLIMSIIRDISAKKESIAQIRKLAYFDDLTGIPNRKNFREALSARIRDGGKPFALMLIDLDRFKEVNDRFSHAVGDAVLIEASRRMLNAIECRGTLYRLGGDEFTVILHAFAERSDAVNVASDMLHAGSRPLELEGHSVTLSLSIGISLFPEHDKGESGLLKKADTAMYRVKNSGGDGFGFYA